MAANVSAEVAVNPHVTTKQLGEAHGISKTSARNILRRYHVHPYKMTYLHALKENDAAKRIEFCNWGVRMLDENPAQSEHILFSDEALFYINGSVNTQNYRYWADINPHWMEGARTLDIPRVMVWCGIWGSEIVGPYFFPGTVTGAAYLDMLQGFVAEWYDNLPLEKLRRLWFQQDGTYAQYALRDRNWLTDTFGEQLIVRGGPVPWPPRSPDLTPLDFYMWGYVKSLVYVDRPQTLEELRERVREEWARRMEQLIAANGQHIEHLQ